MCSSRSNRKRGKPSQENRPSSNRNWTATIDPNVELAFESGEILKPPCTFFRRFKEQHFPAAGGQREEEGLHISKIRYNLSQLGGVEPIGESQGRTSADGYRTVDGPSRLRRDIQSSCNPSSSLGSYTPSSSLNSRYSKLSSSQTPRMSFGSKPVASGLNEIRGWQVVEGEDEGLLFKATDSRFLWH